MRVHVFAGASPEKHASASTLKEISFWKEIFAKWRKFEGNKFWGKCEGNSRRTKEIW
jgi:hypothetical protein